MALLLSQSLLQHRPQYSSVDVGARYLEWYADPRNRDVVWDTGPTAASVFAQAEEAAALPAAALLVHKRTGGQTAGANSVHRVGPLAMACWLSEDEMRDCAWEESGLTHYHDFARGSCVAFVTICRHLILGESWSSSLRAALDLPVLDEQLKLVREELQAALTLAQKVERQAEGGSVRVNTRKLNAGGFCLKVLGAALHFAISATSVEEGLRESKKFAGADNYCPVLVGALLGARFGASQVVPSVHTRSHTREQYAPLMSEVTAAATALAASWAEVVDGKEAAENDDK